MRIIAQVRTLGTVRTCAQVRTLGTVWTCASAGVAGTDALDPLLCMLSHTGTGTGLVPNGYGTLMTDLAAFSFLFLCV